jgi:hypothetical protein
MKKDGYKGGAALYQRNRNMERVRQQMESGWEPDYVQSDPEVVSTEELAQVLRRASDEWEAYHIDTFDHRVQYGFTSVVGELAGLDPRIVRRILLRDTKFTSLHIADKILNVLELTYLIGTEIHVVPNPQWSQERWNAWMALRGCEERV